MKHLQKPHHFTNLFIYVAAVGVILFFLVSGNAPFNSSFYDSLFPKSRSNAADILKSPTVELFINYPGKEKQKGMLNISANDSSDIYLSWQTSGDPKYCYGWSSGKGFEDGSWEGEKEVRGGSFVLPKFTTPNAFVYSIECQNEYGDAEGDSVTINVGSQTQLLPPHLATFDIYIPEQQSTKLDLTTNEPIGVPVGQTVHFQWETLNTSTPYSVCVATGSWPTRFRNQLSSSLIQKQIIEQQKIHHFTIFCSNENNYTKKSLVVIGI